jgi:hypothetical protein
MKVRFKLRGAPDMQRRLKQIQLATLADAERATREAAEREILQRAQANAPVLSGDLRDSAEVNIERNDQRIRASVTFGAPYALIVHEDLDAIHAVGGAKFLERAISDAADEVITNIGARMKKL